MRSENAKARAPCPNLRHAVRLLVSMKLNLIPMLIVGRAQVPSNLMFETDSY